MSDIDVSQLLAQLRSTVATQQAKGPGVEGVANDSNFSQLLQDSIDKVNQLQKNAGNLATAFETGDPKVSLEEVMIALQKANISFQAMTQVRNKLMAAYQEIMNMPV